MHGACRKPGADAGIIKEMDGFTGAMAVIETGNPGSVDGAAL